MPAGQRSVPQLLQPHAHRSDAGTCRDALRVSQRAPRTVFTDGRDLPKDPNPTWFGYSIGRWEGDTLVITSAGFNDQGWLDSSGHPQTETLRLYEIAPGREFTITVTEDLVFVRGLNEPRVPLLVQSETKFMSTTTPIGFEFFKDTRGAVTHVVVRGGAAAEQKAVRKTFP